MAKFLDSTGLGLLWAKIKSHVSDAIAALSEVYAAKVHSHEISEVNGLQTALDGKAAAQHGHAISEVEGLQTALDGKAAAQHGHAISEVEGLQTALDGKAAAQHSHEISEVNGLQDAMDLKAPLASPEFTGVPKVPTADAGTNNTQAASTAFVTTAVANAIGALATVEFIKVDALPESGEAKYIYLVPNAATGTNNIYDEYVWVAAETGGSFEKIGTTELDLSGYWTKEELVALTEAEINAACV